MQAITTKYLGPTNFRGSRIKASCEAGSITLPYDYNENDGGHYGAAVALIKKLGWEDHGRWYRGDTSTGNVYVCSPRHACTSLNIV
jgi:hypothetical protein